MVHPLEEEKSFADVLKKAKVIPLPEVKDLSEPTFAPFPYSCYFQNRLKDMYINTYLMTEYAFVDRDA